METTKLSSKGQIIIPKAVRESHRWEPGQEFIVIDLGDGILLQEKKPFHPTTLKEVAGVLKYDGVPKTIDEMEDAILREAQAQHERSLEDDCG